MKANYHTHTMRCHHASGSDEDYVRSAIKGGYDELGFSDHGCWPYKSDFKPTIRMELSQFDEYYKSIASLREKYKDQISIKIGMESEYFPEYMDWLAAFVKEKKIDYLILGNHFDGSDEDGCYYGWGCNDDHNLVKYVDDAIAGLETGLFAYLAHPDLFMRGRKQFDDLAREQSLRLCRYCKEHNIPLEFNLEGMMVNEKYNKEGYPHPAFWTIAASVGNCAIIGVDAHSNRSLESDYYRNQAIAYLKALNIEIINTIPCIF